MRYSTETALRSPFVNVYTRAVVAIGLACIATVPLAQVSQSPEAIAKLIDEELVAARIPGAAVAVVVGNDVFAGSFGLADAERNIPMTSSTLMHVGSINKLFTAMAVTTVLDSRKIPLSAPIGGYLKGLAPKVSALTFHQLLSQTSGLRDKPGENGSADEHALAAAARALSASDFVVPAGTVFSYSNLGYALAGAALEAIAQKPYADTLYETVFAPLGMNATTLRSSDVPHAIGHRLEGTTLTSLRTPSNDASLWPAGYLWTNARDISRALAAIIHGGRLDDRRVVSSSVVQQITSPHTSMPNVFVGGHYGYGLMLATDRGERIFEHGGTQTGFSAILRVAPDRRVGVAILSNLDNAPLRRIAQVVIAKALDLPAPTAPARAEQVVTVAEMTPRLGLYRNRGTAELTIRDGRVVLILDGGPPMPVSRISEDRFLARPAPDIAGPEFVLRSGYLHFALWAYGR